MTGVDVVFLHGVGGPVPGWEGWLPDCAYSAITVDYTDLVSRQAPGNLLSPLPDPVHAAQRSRRWANPYDSRRHQLEAIVDSAADQDRSHRTLTGWYPRLPALLPTEAVVRFPLLGMRHAARYRTDSVARQHVRQRISDVIAARTRRVVLIGHSLGGIVALDFLHSVGADIELLITVGCPIGIDPAWARVWGDSAFPRDRVGGWLNVVNTRDPIPFGRGAAGAYPEAADAFISAGVLPAGPGGAHDPSTYVRSAVVRRSIEWADLNP